jgi:hypothetical protein
LYIPQKKNHNKKKMENKKIKIRPFLCHDCIGEVISFISSSEIFFNVLLCNKSINYINILKNH